MTNENFVPLSEGEKAALAYLKRKEGELLEEEHEIMTALHIVREKLMTVQFDLARYAK